MLRLPVHMPVSVCLVVCTGVLLGAGSFGRVYRGRWAGLEVAVKVRVLFVHFVFSLCTSPRRPQN